MQKALIADAFGLLNGIALGAITVGQPRIRDDIMQVIERMPPTADPEHSEKLVQYLETVLSRAATSGLTAENQSLTIGLHARRSR